MNGRRKAAFFYMELVEKGLFDLYPKLLAAIHPTSLRSVHASQQSRVACAQRGTRVFAFGIHILLFNGYVLQTFGLVRLRPPLRTDSCDGCEGEDRERC